MTESSLFFTAGDFCSSISEYRDNLAGRHHLLKFKESIEGRLDDETDHQHNLEKNKPENTHSEASDSDVDRLLL